jgi:exodeoxyribonuclease VIII
MNHAPKHIRDNYTEIIPSVYEGVQNDVYHASDGLGSHSVIDIGKSIAHYNWRKKAPLESDSLLKGEALHDLVLLPETFKSKFVIAPTKDKKTNKYKEFVLDHPTQKVLLPNMYDDIYYMRDALYDNPTIRDILADSTNLRECSVWVKDIPTGLLLKCRPDIIVNGIIYDVKTTIAPHDRAFIHSVFEYGYHIQSAFYQYCCKLNGMTVKDFRFLAVGNKPPYLTAIYNLNADLLIEANEYIRTSLNRYAEYIMGTDKWEGLTYGRECVTL